MKTCFKELLENFILFFTAWQSSVKTFCAQFFFSKQKYLTRACVQIDVKTFGNQFSSSKNISLEPRYKLVNTSIVRKKVCTVIWMAQGPAISNRNIIFLEVCKKNKKWQTERAYCDKFNTKITNYDKRRLKMKDSSFWKKKTFVMGSRHNFCNVFTIQLQLSQQQRIVYQKDEAIKIKQTGQ